MTKYKLEIEYVGTNYSGWQIQENAPSIQQAIEEAIFKFCGEKTFAYSCGRTDAGVHAIKMPAHIELSKEYDEYKILMATNFHLSNANETISISVSLPDRAFVFSVLFVLFIKPSPLFLSKIIIPHDIIQIWKIRGI